MITKVLIADPIVLNSDNYISPRTPKEIVEQMGGTHFVNGPIPADKSYPAGSIVFSYQPNLTENEITDQVGDGQFDSVIVAAKKVLPKLGKETINGEPFVKEVVRIGAGTNNVEQVAKAGGVVMNTPGFNSEPTAEAIFLSLNKIMSPDPLQEQKNFEATDMVRQTRQVMARTDQNANSENLSINNHGKWPEFNGTPTEKGKRICIIGASGHIGGLVADKLTEQGQSVVGVSREPEKASKEKPNIKEWTKDILQAADGADVIIIQTPFNDTTEKLITEQVMRKAKPGVIIVNAARAQVVDTDALKKLAIEGHIGGLIADIDHYPHKESPMEPYIQVGEILQSQGKKVILTPHTFADTHSPSREAGAMQAVRQIFRAILHRLGITNAPCINQVGGSERRETEDGCKPETLHPTIAAATGKGGLAASRPERSREIS